MYTYVYVYIHMCVKYMHTYRKTVLVKSMCVAYFHISGYDFPNG